MAEQLKLMGITAHPDDESLGMGGCLAKYAGEGVETHVVCATRGERGRYGDIKERPSIEELGRIREKELRAAADILGVKEVSFLDYIDGSVDQVDHSEAVTKITEHIRRVKPQVVISFGPEGGYGHPDHIAISQFAAAAIVRAADADFVTDDGQATHAVSKFYYMAWNDQQWAAYQAAFKDLRSVVDDVERRTTPWPDWAITTRVDATAHWRTAWKAIQCHRTQMTIYSKLADLSEDYHRNLWGVQTYYRAMSLVNGGRETETDLFAGLR